MFGALCVQIAPSYGQSAQKAEKKAVRRTFDRAHGETPSKLPVPRFVSLRYNTVNGRAGPDTAYPIRWVYHSRGLPVKIIAETENWRRIEDSDGGRVWVQRLNLEARRTVLVKSANAPVLLMRDPSADARVLARMNNGVIGEIIDSRPAWRKIRTGRFVGWVPVSQLWGY
jgi:SH3-like domain-containing protein